MKSFSNCLIFAVEDEVGAAHLDAKRRLHEGCTI